MKEGTTELKASLIIPNYNYSKYLIKRVDPIIAQTY